MNTYLVLKEKHQKEVNDFPFKFAFSDKQYKEAMAEWGLLPSDTDKILKYGNTGGLYLRTDAEKLNEMFERQNKEMDQAIAADTTGEGFIFQMFNYELANHEYVVTYDEEPALNALGLDFDDIRKNPLLSHGLELAIKSQFD